MLRTIDWVAPVAAAASPPRLTATTDAPPVDSTHEVEQLRFHAALRPEDLDV